MYWLSGQDLQDLWHACWKSIHNFERKEGGISLWWPGHGRDDNFKKKGEIVYDFINLNPLIQGRVQWWSITNSVHLMKLGFHNRWEIVLSAKLQSVPKIYSSHSMWSYPERSLIIKKKITFCALISIYFYISKIFKNNCNPLGSPCRAVFGFWRWKVAFFPKLIGKFQT